MLEKMSYIKRTLFNNNDDIYGSENNRIPYHKETFDILDIFEYCDLEYCDIEKIMLEASLYGESFIRIQQKQGASTTPQLPISNYPTTQNPGSNNSQPSIPIAQTQPSNPNPFYIPNNITGSNGFPSLPSGSMQSHPLHPKLDLQYYKDTFLNKKIRSIFWPSYASYVPRKIEIRQAQNSQNDAVWSDGEYFHGDVKLSSDYSYVLTNTSEWIIIGDAKIDDEKIICTCLTSVYMNLGCQCGAFKREMELKRRK